MGGKFHLKLNIGERPIANKYREEDESTLERELKQYDEICLKETFEVSRVVTETQPCFLAWCHFSVDGSGIILTVG